MDALLVKGKRKHLIGVAPSLIWTIPFLQEAWLVGFPIDRLFLLKAFKVPPSRLEQQKGCTTRKKSGFVITMCSSYQIVGMKKGRRIVEGYLDVHESGFVMEMALDILSHELSHLSVWGHTADRLIAEKALQFRFATLAKKMGYNGYSTAAGCVDSQEQYLEYLLGIYEKIKKDYAINLGVKSAGNKNKRKG